jgi:hypothetical protein
VLSDFTQSCGRDSLESEFRLLDTENKETNGTCINDGLGKLMGVLGNASKSPSSSLLD